MAVKCISSYNGTETNGAVQVNIINFLLQKGFTVDQMIGIMGNIDVESDGFKTAVLEYSGGGGHGLIQWTDTRWHNLEAFAKKNNKSWKDLDLQLDFLWHELNTDEKATLQWFSSHPKASIKESVLKWQNGFERCGKCHQNDRMAAADRAKAFYEKYANSDCANVQFLKVDGDGSGGDNNTVVQTEERKLSGSCGISVNVTSQQSVSSDSGENVNVGNVTIGSGVATENDIKKLNLTTNTRKRTRKLSHIFLHYTAGPSSEPGAYEETKHTLLSRGFSSDFIIDDGNIVQWAPDIEKYHSTAIGAYAKDGQPNNDRGKGVHNGFGVSLEICSNCKPCKDLGKNGPKKQGDYYNSYFPNHEGWFFTSETLTNAAKLCRYLMQKYSIPKDNIIRHYDIQGKSCPGVIGWNPNSGSESAYQAFVNAL